MNALIKKLFNENVAAGCSMSAVLVAGNMVDAVVTGQCLGKDALSAFGIAGPIIYGMSGLSGMLGIGAVLTIGKSIGRGDREDTERTISTLSSTCLVLGLALMLILIFFAYPLAGAMGADSRLAPGTAAYLLGYAFGVPAFIFQMVLSFLMPLDSDRTRVIKAMVVCAAVNISLDLMNGFFIHGGLFGMALATSISYYAELAVFLIHFRNKNHILKLGFGKFDFSVLCESLKSGVPYALQMTFKMTGVILINRIIVTNFNNDSVAVFSVLMSCSYLILIDATSIGTATTTLDGCFVGEQDGSSVVALLKIAFAHGIIVNIILSVFFILISPLLLHLFTNDSMIYQAAVPAFRMYSTSIMLYGIIFVIRSHLQCVGKYGLSIILAAFDILIGPVLAALILSGMYGTEGIWLCYTVGEGTTLAGFIIFTIIRKNYFYLDPAQFPENSECYEKIIEYGKDEMRMTAEASEEIVSFLTVQGADTEHAVFMGVCAEELCTNIVRYGFKSAHNVLDIRVYNKNKKWNLRIRDNCSYFNINEYMKTHNEQGDKYGLKMVYALSGSVDYLCVLSTNQVTICLDSERNEK